jgi:tetratricopeptide (TPR) repeat protein
MNYILDVLRLLTFRSRSLRNLSAREAVAAGVTALALGFCAYVWVRNSVYASLIHAPYVQGPPNALEVFLDSNLLQTVLFLTLVYVPAIIALSNAFAGDGLGFTISRIEYTGHLSALLPLWGILLLLAAPVQWLVPQFLILGIVDISVGMFWLLVSMAVYTLWAVRELSYIPTAAALGVCALSWFTLPVFFVLTRVLLALPLFLVLPVLILFVRRVRDLLATKTLLRGFRRHLQTLMRNPQDADAHFQLGLLHFRSGHFDTARGYFERALAIDSQDPDYHYHMGRIHEGCDQWEKAAEEYEETYRLSPEYGTGDIFREVGKGYLHTGRVDKAIEFLRYFLERRTSDPEGRYWLAVALRRAGKTEEMRTHLNTVLDQARTNPRFFRKQNRNWIYRSRLLLHGALE